jgi:hypothetical protein
MSRKEALLITTQLLLLRFPVTPEANAATLMTLQRIAGSLQPLRRTPLLSTGRGRGTDMADLYPVVADDGCLPTHPQSDFERVRPKVESQADCPLHRIRHQQVID